MKKVLIFFATFIIVQQSYSQKGTDSIKVHTLDSIEIEAIRVREDIKWLAPIQGTYIYSGKKNEVIVLSQSNVTLSEKYGRQVFSKIPGLFVYDMDGTGNQMNVSTRGLDPHRSWEFNIRKDGIITNSDMYGYPASHYNIPLEAVERIELVRGTGSLQYGAQFGGMLNYVSKQPDTTKQLFFESINTVGSYGLVSTYNGASGKIGKVRYSAWLNKKWITGYRDNSDANFDAGAATLFYDVSKKLHLKFEVTHSNYVTHLAGPLTDSMFYDDPQMSTRARNYYNPNIYIPSISIDWKLTSNTQVVLTTSAVLGTRNSVLFDRPATIADTIVSSTLEYNNRQVDVDHFNSYTTELRLLHSYKFLKQMSSISGGMQYMNNDLHRQQQGKGTTGTDYDLTLVVPGWGRDLHYKTINVAIFAENRWLLTKKLSVNTGARIEIGESNLTGEITYYADTALPNTIKHNFPLFGVSTQYDFTPNMNFYGGVSQGYRPVILKEIIPASTYEVSDKNLKDAYGYTAEIGIRGKWKFLKWDLTAFHLQYNNRMGTLEQTDSAGNFITYRTNIGNSQTNGVEIFVQGDFLLGLKTSISLFTSTSFMNAIYEDAIIKSGNENVNIDGNKVESVPSLISRNGLTIKYSEFSFSALYSYTSETFADALNTVTPSASGATGLVPSYQILDLNLGIRLNSNIKLQLNASNVLDEHYFTKRPQFYPGPGIWPSDGRTISGTVSIKI
jgi:Fe(3+) dicitrate transport protein